MSVPLVAEDSAFLRSSFLAEGVLSAVSDKVEPEDKPLTRDDVLEAMDRGGKTHLLLEQNLPHIGLCKDLMVASSTASVFILRARTQTIIKVWDHAVGMLCVHEAGGQVIDWRAIPLDLAVDQLEWRVIFPSGGVLVSNGNLHNHILKMISSSSVI